MAQNALIITVAAVVVIATAGAVLLAAPAGAEPIKIGFIGPLTGDVATLGIPLSHSVELAVEEINARGGINGQKIQLIQEDGRCNPKDASQAATKLIEIDKVIAIVGGFCSGETLGAAPIAERNGVIMFSPASSNPGITSSGDYIFRNYPSDAFQGKIAAEYIFNKRGDEKVALLYIKNDWGDGIKSAFRQRFEELGGEILVEETFEQGAKDLRTQLIKVKDSEPEFIYFPSYPTETALGLQQANELGLSSNLFLGGDGAEDRIVSETVGKTGDGFMWIVPMVSPPEDFVQKFRAKSGQEPTLGVPQAYDAMKILASVMEKVGPSSEAIKDELYNIQNYPGVSGSITLDENGDLAVPLYQFRIIEDGNMVDFPSDTGEPIKIGATLPLTGDVASFGEDMQKAITLAADDVNAAGGINGRALEVIFEDDVCDGKQAVNTVRKLISVDGVPAIIGPVCSTALLPVAPIAEENRVVLFSGSATAASITDAGDYVFRNIPSDTFQGKFAAEFMFSELNASRVAVEFSQEDYGQGLRDVFVQRFEELGGTIVLTESHDRAETDFRTQIAKIKQADPDAIYFPGFPVDIANFVKQMREGGVEMPIVGSETVSDPQVVEIAQEAAEGLMYTVPKVQTSQEFKDAFAERFDKEPLAFSDYKYDIVHLLANAMRTCGSDSVCIKNELYKVDGYEGASGTITLDSNGDLAGAEFEVMVYRNGTAAPLE